MPLSIRPPVSFTNALNEYTLSVSKSSDANTDSTPVDGLSVNTLYVGTVNLYTSRPTSAASTSDASRCPMFTVVAEFSSTRSTKPLKPATGASFTSTS